VNQETFADTGDQVTKKKSTKRKSNKGNEEDNFGAPDVNLKRFSGFAQRGILGTPPGGGCLGKPCGIKGGGGMAGEEPGKSPRPVIGLVMELLPGMGLEVEARRDECMGLGIGGGCGTR
jgi:hypothetical protein